MKIAFVIRSLGVGGAERQLVATARLLHNRQIPVVVLAFYGGGAFEGELREAGVPVRVLEKGGRWNVFSFLARLRRTLREERTDLSYAYLGTEKILLAMLKRFLAPCKIVWGVRASCVDMRHYDWLTNLMYQVEPRFSPMADLVIANSFAGRRAALERGYPSEKMTVIPNGIDMQAFSRFPRARERLRCEWGVTPSQVLIGRVGRLDPMKDYPNFIRAAKLLSTENQELRFVCVGDGPQGYRQSLCALASELNLEQRLLWSGARADMGAVYSALDLLVSSSCSEGFPNALGEAMACGTPCVATDVGDSALVLGDYGVVVKSGDAEALANACRSRLTNGIGGPERLAMRRYIEEKYSIERMVDQTLSALRSVFLSPQGIGRLPHGALRVGL